MMLSAALPLRLRLLAAATLSLTLLASCASVARAEPQAPRLTDFTGDPAAEPSTKAARAIASGSASLRAGLEPPRPSTAADDGAVVHLPDNRGSVRYDIFARQIAKYYCMHTRRWPIVVASCRKFNCHAPLMHNKRVMISCSRTVPGARRVTKQLPSAHASAIIANDSSRHRPFLPHHRHLALADSLYRLPQEHCNYQAPDHT